MQEIKCNLCGSGFYKIIYKIKSPMPDDDRLDYKITENRGIFPILKIVQCLRCGLVYAAIRENIEDIFLMYRNMKDDVYTAEEEGRRASARIILDRISKYKNKGMILDIGCATGFLLDEARKRGWQAQGVELSKWAVDYAHEKFGLDIFEGVLKDAKFPYNYFDAVVMLDSIEHLLDPKSTLEEIRRILKPTGVLCVSTPDIESFLSRILRARWWGLQQAHLYYFSRKTLGEMFDIAGFQVLKYKSHIRIFSLGYWNLRLKNYNTSLGKLFNLSLRIFGLDKKLININFWDQIEVFVRKKRSLAHIYDDERLSEERQENTRMKTIAVLPAYNAAKTLGFTVRDMPKDLVDEIILVDDKSTDDTAEIARQLGLKVFIHPKNKGYGANQKTCYSRALELGAEIVVMVHPDYQYDPTVIPKLIEPIQKGQADAVFGSRMIKGGALGGGMPIWKHNANILLTAFENVILGTYLSEYHSGFRAYSAKYLKTVNFMMNSDGFIFDNEIIIQGLLNQLKIEEVPIKTRYFEEASTIKLFPSIIYGFGILKTILKYILHVNKIVHFKQFE